MKKWIIAVVSVVLLLLLAVYLIIPADLKVSASAVFYAPYKRSMYFVTNENQWHRWWPATGLQAQQPGGKNSFTYHDSKYEVTQRSENLVEIAVRSGDQVADTRITVLPLPSLTSGIEWSCELKGGHNPIARINQYYRARRIKNDMDSLLERMKIFMEKEKNIYGMVIEHLKVKDTVLISTKTIYSEYPALAEIYKMVQRLRDYIKSQDAREMNYPMLHIRPADNGGFEAMVAIPTNRLLQEKGDIVVKRMAPGNILFAEVKGGNHAIREGFELMEYYKEDHGLSSPAIPFESLVTDRLKEPDSTKWITHLYYPIF